MAHKLELTCKPNSIAELKVLNSLKLSRNDFTGQVPGEIQFMKGLTILDLSYNNLSVQVPPRGQFLVFKHGVILCPSSSTDKTFGSHKLTLTTIIGAAMALTIVILLILLTVYRTREEASPETEALGSSRPSNGCVSRPKTFSNA
ncbi:LRR domain containing protein [Trema orientale]|uniref:LRR domain containing protein n=1 Tax=Trema orientale TaxID=63057 RepID=A0A2P5F830_TREOI|nr:LRR domain containing protein [Trema orientale]